MDGAIQKLNSLHIDDNHHLPYTESNVYSHEDMMLMKTEFDRVIHDHERRHRATLEENEILRDTVGKIEKENQALRQAVKHLEVKKQDYMDKEQTIVSLETEIRKLRQNNYALQVHLQQTNSIGTNNSFTSRSPDVF